MSELPHIIIMRPILIREFARHAHRDGDFLLSNYGGVAATTNVSLERLKGEKFEYTDALKEIGFDLVKIKKNPGGNVWHIKIAALDYFALAARFGIEITARKMRELEEVASSAPRKECPEKKHAPCLENGLERCKKMSPSEFYESWEWKTARYEALKKYGPKCMLCGATAKDGVRICVDHIRPRALYPDLQLDLNNLQVLCNDCNMGKGRWDETSWA